MELPDESVAFNPHGLLAPASEEWTPSAELRSRHLIGPARYKELQQRLLLCRSQVAADREMRNAPAEYLPLEPGFINLPQDLLDAYRRKQDASDLGKCISLAARLRDDADRVVFLGAGGSYLGARALFAALRSSHHNELPPEARLGVPRVYFDGHSTDTDTLQELLDLLQITCVDPERREERWAVVTLTKSGTSIEPGIALRVFRREATEYYGLRSPWLTRLFAGVTGPSTKMRELFLAQGLGEDGVLTVPENVGGRFSVFTPAGLLPAAVMGLDVRALLLGAAAMTKRFLEEPVERNPVLQLAGTHYLMQEEHEKPIRVLSVWSNKLAGVGAWYEHLVAESLGKQGRGPTPLTVVQPGDLHTRQQLHQDGPRDRVITNLFVKSPQSVPIVMGMADHNEDGLNTYNRKSMAELTRAALEAVNQGMYEVGRPTCDIALPGLSEHAMGQLLQMLMLATIVEGRLMGINPYSAPSAEGYRRTMDKILKAPADPAAPVQASASRPL